MAGKRYAVKERVGAGASEGVLEAVGDVEGGGQAGQDGTVLDFGELEAVFEEVVEGEGRGGEDGDED